jgi:hypothetical protein
MKSKESLKSLCGITPDQQEADFSGQRLGAVDAMLIANDISNTGAISSVNLLQNHIGPDQAAALVSILKEHPTLKSLCGNRGDETTLDMRGKMNGADDAIMLAAEIVDNGALIKLDISSNQIGRKEEQDLQRICVAGGIELVISNRRGGKKMGQKSV